jgi:cellulose synthase/poly-beta-1,6-N-acetylglucosamine synthase-like glycosyltransferase
MSNCSKLTICICMKNSEGYISDCIGSILEEFKSIDSPPKVLVVDHGSKDNSKRIAEEFAKKVPNIISVLHFPTPGIAAIRDFAWRTTSTPWVAFLDSDCIVHKGWVRNTLEQIEEVETNQEIAAIGGINYPPQKRSFFSESLGLMLNSFVGGHDSILNRTFTISKEVDHCPTLNVVYRKSALEAIGGFSHVFSRVAEDLDLSFRLKKHKYKLIASPSMKVTHLLKPNLKSWLLNMYLYGRGRVFFMKHHPASFQLRFLAPLSITLLYFSFILSSLLGHSFIFLLLFGAMHSLSILFVFCLAGEAIKNPGKLLYAGFITILTHVVYGLGMLVEIPRNKNAFSW